MAGEIFGRDVVISVDGTVWAAAETKSLAINNEMIDVTADGDLGLQRFITRPGKKSVEVTLEAFFDANSESLQDKALSDDLSMEIILDYGAYTITGTFVMPSYSEDQPTAEATKASVTFQSSGAVVKAVVV